MSHLPNLGALGLRLRVAKTGTNALPDPKRQKTSGAQDPDVLKARLRQWLRDDGRAQQIWAELAHDTSSDEDDEGGAGREGAGRAPGSGLGSLTGM